MPNTATKKWNKPFALKGVMSVEDAKRAIDIGCTAFPIYESMINYTGSTAVPYDLTEDKDLKFSADKKFYL